MPHHPCQQYPSAVAHRLELQTPKWCPQQAARQTVGHLCARCRRLVEQQELRAPECFRVWGFCHNCQGWGSGGTGVRSISESCARDAGWRRSSPISIDRPSRSQASMCGGGAINVGESCVRARYGLRGVRVGEGQTLVHHTA